MALLEITDLEVFYGKARSISGVSLSVNEGQIVVSLGPMALANPLCSIPYSA